MSQRRDIFKQKHYRRPSIIRFDQGGEFKSETKRYLEKEGIRVFYTQNSQIKSNYAERIIRNIKNKIYAYFMEKQTYKYIDVLQNLVHSYNNTPPASLGGATPASVTEDNKDELRYIQYLTGKKININKKKLNINAKKSVKEEAKKKRKKKLYKFRVGVL